MTRCLLTSLLLTVLVSGCGQTTQEPAPPVREDNRGPQSYNGTYDSRVPETDATTGNPTSHTPAASGLTEGNVAADNPATSYPEITNSAFNDTARPEQRGDAANNAAAADSARVEKAICVLMPVGDSGVSGTVRFNRQGDQVQVRGEVQGLTPGKHGFHVHQFGDLSDREKGLSAGGHFDPEGHEHGRPEDDERHVGDLGNIEADENGKAIIEINDNVLKLNGPHSILGRALVVHAKEDQFTQPSGDAGGRVSFGVIGVAKSE